jgi:tRNA dimethylallyltransferase
VKRVFVLCGPTGVGKTDVAVRLAERHGSELVSADSRQVYTWLDIGTAKPSPDVRRKIGIHMVDMVEPNRVYSAADYARDALAVMRRLTAEGRRSIVVGGAGLYLRALFQPFFDAPRPDPALRARLTQEPASELYARLRQVDPDRAVRLHPNDRQRIMRALEVFEQTGKTMTALTKEAEQVAEFQPIYTVLSMPRADLYRRIDQRFDAMMQSGLLDEVRRLMEAGFGRDTYVANAYGYAELLDHLEGRLTLEQAVQRAKAKSRAYAALTGAHWVDCNGVEDAVARVEPLLVQVLTGLT